MAVFKCKMCGGELVLTEGSNVAECEYCCTIQTVPSADNEKKLTLFTRANRLRFGCEFDKAAGIYESIVADFPEEAEAYWGLVLCKYGIEYVDDPATGKKIPTCHRSSFEGVMDDNNFEMTLEYADVVARKVYREEAKQIEEIRKGIIEVSGKEEPYDIFICYKETDEGGQRTLDSVLAQDIYDALTEKGYRVFFARITLEDKLGLEYEPYIFAALNSAKLMLAVGTDYDYYNAVWVKNEWSRYLKLMAADKSKHLIPCYKGLDAYDMPKEFAKLQAQDLGKVGAMQDLLRGIDKLMDWGEKKPNAQPVYRATPASSGPSAQSLLQRAMIFLEDGDWRSADEYCEKVLDIDPQNAQAYLGKLMAELHAHRPEELADSSTSLASNRYYSRALRYADATTADALRWYENTIQNRVQQAQKERIYRTALESARKESIADQKTAIEQFEKIPGYKDADHWIAVCTHKCREDEERRAAEARRIEEIGFGDVELVVLGGGNPLTTSADGCKYKFSVESDAEHEEVVIEAAKRNAAQTLRLPSGQYKVMVNVYSWAAKELKEPIHSVKQIPFTLRKNQKVRISVKRSLWSPNIVSIT